MFVGATETKTLSPLRGLCCMVELLPGVTLLSIIYHFFGFDVSEHSARGLQKVPHDYYLNLFYFNPKNRIISYFLYCFMLNSVKIL